MKIDVPIDGCQHLELMSSVDPYDQNTGSGNHVVWGEPRAWKDAPAVQGG